MVPWSKLSQNKVFLQWFLDITNPILHSLQPFIRPAFVINILQPRNSAPSNILKVDLLDFFQQSVTTGVCCWRIGVFCFPLLCRHPSRETYVCHCCSPYIPGSINYHTHTQGKVSVWVSEGALCCCLQLASVHHRDRGNAKQVQSNFLPPTASPCAHCSAFAGT